MYAIKHSIIAACREEIDMAEDNLVLEQLRKIRAEL